MRKLVLGVLILPVLLILALPASNMLLNEARLWVFAKQLSEVDELFQGHFDVLATGSEVYVSGNDEVCGFRAARLYRHYESAESAAAIKKNIEDKNFSAARERADGGYAESYVAVTGSYLAVVIQEGAYPAWFDIRCW